jgi:hypothetical protein
MANDSKSVAHFRCYAIAPLTGVYALAHEWSAPYPRYSKDDTSKKLQHALADAGPSTCSAIRYDRAGEEYCRECQHWGKIKSPLVLGMPRQRSKSQKITQQKGAREVDLYAPREPRDPEALPYSDYTNALALVRGIFAYPPEKVYTSDYRVVVPKAAGILR